MKQAIKLAAYRFANRIGLFSLADRAAANDVRILCYHGVWRVDDDFPGDAMFIRASTFERRLDVLLDHGYRVVSLDEAVAALRGEAEPLRKAVVITIDDGWLGTYEDMLPSLLARDMPATLYCDTGNLLSGLPIANVLVDYVRAAHTAGGLSNSAEAAYAASLDMDQPLASRWAACRSFADEISVDLAPYVESGTFSYMTPANLRDAADRGLDVQLHTHNHTLRQFDEATIAEEIGENRRRLSEILGRAEKDLKHFCYPSGVHATSAFPVLERLGVRSATTCELRLATPRDAIQALPRILDNGAASDVEFLAELAGVGARMRRFAA